MWLGFKWRSSPRSQTGSLPCCYCVGPKCGGMLAMQNHEEKGFKFHKQNKTYKLLILKQCSLVTPCTQCKKAWDPTSDKHHLWRQVGCFRGELVDLAADMIPRMFLKGGQCTKAYTHSCRGCFLRRSYFREFRTIWLRCHRPNQPGKRVSPMWELRILQSWDQLPHADVLVNLLDVSPARSWASERHILEKSYQLATTYSPSRADRVSLAILTYNLVVRLKLILETEWHNLRCSFLPTNNSSRVTSRKQHSHIEKLRTSISLRAPKLPTDSWEVCSFTAEQCHQVSLVSDVL